MKEGWLTRWWMIIIKSPFIMRGRMRRRGKAIDHMLPHIKYMIYSKIPQDIEAHFVTRGLGEQKDLLKKEERPVEKKEFELAFYDQVEEVLTLDEIKEIEKTVLSHEQQHGATGYEKEFGQKMRVVLENAGGEDRKEYFKYVEPIIKVAEKTGDKNTLMAALKEMGPNQFNIMAALALIIEIRIASRGIKKLRHEKKDIRNALMNWDNSKSNKKGQENQIKILLQEVSKDAETTLHNDALIAKRDFLLTLLTIKYLDDEEEFMEEWISESKHLMPRLPEQERINDIEEWKKTLGEHAHVLAQGLRRIMALEQSDERLAEEIEYYARKRAA